LCYSVVLFSSLDFDVIAVATWQDLKFADGDKPLNLSFDVGDPKPVRVTRSGSVQVSDHRRKFAAVRSPISCVIADLLKDSVFVFGFGDDIHGLVFPCDFRVQPAPQ
jgi:hypothetical protein